MPSPAMSSSSSGGFGNRLVWVPDAQDGYVLAQIQDILADAFTVQLLANRSPRVGRQKSFFQRQVPSVDCWSASDREQMQDDNCGLIYLNEATLLHNTKQRYMNNKIYTYVANILIAVNPYTDIPGIYDVTAIQKYRGQSLGTLPPHLFAIADKAYRDMRRNRESQSVIVSGESGAGKTESQKYILRFLCDSYGDGHGQIERRILDSNPILEAFGNAKTLRNNNSSRFGKFLEIHFTNKFTVAGGFVSHYLLERARVCRQNAGERNFHIFYQILAGIDEKLRAEFKLTAPDKYNYLRHGSTRYFVNDKTRANLLPAACSAEHASEGGLSDPVVDDVSDFARIDAALANIDIDLTTRQSVYATLAGILHLGNVAFEENHADSKGGSVVTSDSQTNLAMAGRLFGLEPDELRMGLLTRVMQPTKAGIKGTLIRVPLKPAEAAAARDALAKSIYSKLFDYIVHKINKSIPFNQQTATTYIGVLDIAGFEYFTVNSFEQFCINYCNEKLQQFFNTRILIQEQDLYEKEGLNVKRIEFIDNQDCIDLIEQKGTGILDLLDEEMKLPRADYHHFTAEVHQRHKQHFRLEMPRKSKLKEHRELVRDDEGFLIRHFAGAVCYQTNGFLEKNNDALHDSLAVLLEDSKSPIIKRLFQKAPQSPQHLEQNRRTGGAGGRKLVVASVGSKFRRQLGQLLDKLDQTGTHFVRCLKPNGEMRPLVFDGPSVLSQLKCSGMPSVLELMQQGFPSRTNFAGLYDTYKSCLPPKLSRLEPRLFAKCLFKALGLNDADYKFGLTKVFFRPGKFAEFDAMLRSDPEHLAELVVKVQAWLVRTRWKQWQWCALSVVKLRRKIVWRREQLVKIQSATRSWAAQKRHKHRIVTSAKCSQLQTQVQMMTAVVDEMSIPDSQQQYSVKVKQLASDVAALKHKIKTQPDLPKAEVTAAHDRLLTRADALVNEMRSVVKQNKQEQQKLRQLEQKAEEDRKRRAQEAEKEVQKQQEAAERQRIETDRKQAEVEYNTLRREQLAQFSAAMTTASTTSSKQPQPASASSSASSHRSSVSSAAAARQSLAELTDSLLAYDIENDVDVDPEVRAEQARLLDMARQRKTQLEQEKLDREMAMRLARETADGDLINLNDEYSYKQLTSPTQSASSTSTNKSADLYNKDMAAWTYADLRDMINNSTDMDLIQACRDEFHRRLANYHRWQNQNSVAGGPSAAAGNASDQTRAPADILRQGAFPTAAAASAPTARQHRFFRVPLAVRPSDRYRDNRTTGGFWYAHFNGQYVARQFEMHPPKKPVPLIAGRDDLKMCELPLAQTGLTIKRGVEITQQEFDTAWRITGGPTYDYANA